MEGVCPGKAHSVLLGSVNFSQPKAEKLGEDILISQCGLSERQPNNLITPNPHIPVSHPIVWLPDFFSESG